VAGEGLVPVTPAEQWTQAWEAVRGNLLFLLPGWWYPLLTALAAAGLALGPARRANGVAVLAGLFTLMLFTLVALGVFGSTRVVLPFLPTSLTLLVALLLGRAGHSAGWLGK
jgi:hypothetical protein